MNTKYKGSGTRQWSNKSINFQTGCEHNCLVCYAKDMAVKFNQIKKNDWENPTIRLDDVNKKISMKFKDPGDIIIELGINKGEIGGSEYLSLRKNEILGDAPTLDLDYESRLHKLCQIFAMKEIVRSMHDISDGGIAVALAESLSESEEIGCKIELDSSSRIRKDFLLFGESQSRIIVSCKPEKLADVLMEAGKFAIDAKQIGITTRNRQIQIGKIIDLSVDEALNVYNKSIELKMPIEEE